MPFRASSTWAGASRARRVDRQPCSFGRIATAVRSPFPACRFVLRRSFAVMTDAANGEPNASEVDRGRVRRGFSAVPLAGRAARREGSSVTKRVPILGSKRVEIDAHRPTAVSAARPWRRRSGAGLPYRGGDLVGCVVIRPDEKPSGRRSCQSAAPWCQTSGQRRDPGRAGQAPRQSSVPGRQKGSWPSTDIATKKRRRQV